MTIFFSVIITAILLKIAYTDFKEKAIFDLDLILAALLIGIYKLYSAEFISGCFGALAGFITGYIIYAATLLIYKAEGFGFGDVLLLAVLGLFWGWPMFLDYFTVTMILTGFTFLFLIILKPSIKYVAVPFAPILIFWIPVYLFSGTPTIFQIYAHIMYITNF